MASGMPSSFRQTLATAWRPLPKNAESSFRRCALSKKSLVTAKRRQLSLGQQRGIGGLRHGQRGYPPHHLPGHAQRLSAGGQDPQLRAGIQQLVRKVRHGLDQVLAVVQDEQKILRSQLLRERGAKRATRPLAHPERPGHHLRHQLGLA